MLPASRRTHGCATCKARKVKCDCKWPQCSQCIGLRRARPGTTAGLIFVNALVNPDPSGSPSEPYSSTTHSNREEPVSTSIDITSAVQSHSSASGPPPPIRNLKEEVLYHLATDISRYHRMPWAPDPWFLDVPSLALSSPLESSVIFTMRAVSLTSLALKCKSESVERAARSFYVAALKSQSKALSRTSDNNGPLEYKAFFLLLATSMLLFEFEMSLPSGPYSWISHAQGAAHILEKMSPQSCQEMPLHKIFLALRHIMAYVSLATGVPSFLGTTDWTKIPFLNRPKTSIDHLIDHLLCLSHIKGHDLGYPEDTEVHLERLYYIRERLNAWWAKHKSQCLESNRQGSYQPPVLRANCSLQVLGTLCSIGQLVVSSKLESIDPSFHHYDSERPDEHSGHILSSARHLSNTMPLSIQLHTLFAIHLVVLYTPFTTQREKAHGLIQQYQQNQMGKVWVP